MIVTAVFGLLAGFFAVSAYRWRQIALGWRESSNGWRRIADENLALSTRLMGKLSMRTIDEA